MSGFEMVIRMERGGTDDRNPATLLSPDTCCLLLIDPDKSRASINRNTSKVDPDSKFRELVKTAVGVSVPVLLSSIDDGASSETKSCALGDFKHEYFSRKTVNPWRDAHLKEAIFEHGRDRLILAGGWAEGSLVQAALSAAADAYDVHVLFDLPDDFLLHDDLPVAQRLIQAGVVPLTLQQLILELAGTSNVGSG